MKTNTTISLTQAQDLINLIPLSPLGLQFLICKYERLLREDVSIHPTNLKHCGKSSKIQFHSYFHIFVVQYVLMILVYFFFVKMCFSFREIIFFRSTPMQIFNINITRVVWPRVTNKLDLWYFCQQNPLYYHINLIPCHYWSWQRNICFLVNFFVRHTFLMSKRNIKTKTVITMTDRTESTELRAFKRQRDS